MPKKILLLCLSLLSPTLLPAQGIDEAINSVFDPVTRAIESVVFFTVTIGDYTIPFVLIWLIVGAIFLPYTCGSSTSQRLSTLWM